MKPTAVTVGGFPEMPYSAAVKAGEFLYVSGQTGMDYRSGKMSDDFETQARMAFENLAAVLRSAGCNLGNVVKTTVWLKDAKNFDAMNKLYKEYFPVNAPARSTPVVDLPKPAYLISIEAVAVV